MGDKNQFSQKELSVETSEAGKASWLMVKESGGDFHG